MSIGCPGRPFATADPKLDDLLPADDAAWDRGVRTLTLCSSCLIGLSVIQVLKSK